MTEDYYINLKKIREERGFTQSQVANYLGISRQAVSHWERGVSYPDIDNIILLCELYQISVNDLIPSHEEIDIEENKSETESGIKNTKDTDLHSVIEILSILVVLALASQIAFLGMIMPILVVIWAIKKKKHVKVLCFVSIIAFMLGTYNTVNIVSYFIPDYGTSYIKKI